jgi:hypothetical protein
MKTAQLKSVILDWQGPLKAFNLQLILFKTYQNHQEKINKWIFLRLEKLQRYKKQLSRPPQVKDRKRKRRKRK